MGVPDSMLKAAQKCMGDVDDAVDAAIEMLNEFGLPEARAILTIATLPDPTRGRALNQALARRAKTDKRVVSIGKNIKERATCGQPDALLNEAEDLVLSIRLAEAAGQSAEQLKRRAETVNRALANLVPNPLELQMAVSFVAVSKTAGERRYGPFETAEAAATWAKANLPEREPAIEPIFDPNKKMALPTEPFDVPQEVCGNCGEVHDQAR